MSIMMKFNLTIEKSVSFIKQILTFYDKYYILHWSWITKYSYQFLEFLLVLKIGKTFK